MIALAYVRERVLTVKVAALWFFVAWMTFAHDWRVHGVRMEPAAIAFAVLLVLAFRLSDDCASHAQDRMRFPTRVLSRMDSLFGCRMAIIALAAAITLVGVVGTIPRATLAVALLGIVAPFFAPGAWSLGRYGLLVFVVGHHPPAALACVTGIFVFDSVEDARATAKTRRFAWALFGAAQLIWAAYAQFYEHKPLLAVLLALASLSSFGFSVPVFASKQRPILATFLLLALLTIARQFSAP